METYSRGLESTPKGAESTGTATAATMIKVFEIWTMMISLLVRSLKELGFIEKKFEDCVQRWARRFVGGEMGVRPAEDLFSFPLDFIQSTQRGRR